MRHKGFKHSEATKQKLRDAHKRRVIKTGFERATVTFTCAYCGVTVTKFKRGTQSYKYCSQACNTKKLSVKTYKERYGYV